MLVNEADIDWSTVEWGPMTVRRKKLGAAAGGEQLGCSLYELPGGEAAWPYHYHTANEEAMYVLDGTGTLRLDGDAHEVSAGDYVALPANESGGHRVRNDGHGVLRYLVVSTMQEPDVTVYPDSEKFGVFVGSSPGSEEERSLHGYYREDDAVDYWADE